MVVTASEASAAALTTPAENIPELLIAPDAIAWVWSDNASVTAEPAAFVVVTLTGVPELGRA